jgi:hypothetical protein
MLTAIFIRLALPQRLQTDRSRSDLPLPRSRSGFPPFHPRSGLP